MVSLFAQGADPYARDEEGYLPSGVRIEGREKTHRRVEVDSLMEGARAIIPYPVASDMPKYSASLKGTLGMGTPLLMFAVVKATLHPREGKKEVGEGIWREFSSIPLPIFGRSWVYFPP